MKVIEQALSKEKQEWLKNILLSSAMPLWYMNNITDKSSKDYCPAFNHNFILDDKIQTKQAEVLNIFKDIIKGNVDCARMFVQLPLNTKVLKNKQDPPHIDVEKPHQVYIYYVKDSDGDTVIFKNKKEWKRITPKQGRMITFDGSLWHTAEQPTNGTRCIINFNVT
jgi:hypothetical protein